MWREGEGKRALNRKRPDFRSKLLVSDGFLWVTEQARAFPAGTGRPVADEHHRIARPRPKAAADDQDCGTSEFLSREATTDATGSCGRSNNMRRSNAVERIMG